MIQTVLLALLLMASSVTVRVDGIAVEFADQQPVIINNRTFVPVRDVFEQMGYIVDWNQDTAIATLSNHSNLVIIPSESDIITINGNAITPDTAQQIINGRLMLPLRAVVEGVGGFIDWDEAANEILIITPQVIRTDLAGFELGTQLAPTPQFRSARRTLADGNNTWHFFPTGANQYANFVMIRTEDNIINYIYSAAEGFGIGDFGQIGNSDIYLEILGEIIGSFARKSLLEMRNGMLDRLALEQLLGGSAVQGGHVLITFDSRGNVFDDLQHLIDYNASILEVSINQGMDVGMAMFNNKIALLFVWL